MVQYLDVEIAFARYDVAFETVSLERLCFAYHGCGHIGEARTRRFSAQVAMILRVDSGGAADCSAVQHGA
eukprot:6191622-Pleurochrysis_carterae.AAC.5